MPAVESHLAGVTREVIFSTSDDRPMGTSRLASSFPTTVANLWDSVSNIERIPQWFAPVSGDFRLGGRYSIEHNASGTITACQPPAHYAITWEIFGDVGRLDVNVSNEAEQSARLQFDHMSPLSDHWVQYGPGATGVGWEMAFLGLALYISQPSVLPIDEMEFATSEVGKHLIERSSSGWGEAAIAAGENVEVARTAAKNTFNFFTGTTE